MILFPGTKINLGLRITEKRGDGFHNLQTVFYPLNYSDILEAAPSGKFAFRSSGISVPVKPEDNLVVKAFRLMQEKYEIPNVKIHLHKIVPDGTGLGGGSADAAATIKLLNRVFSLGFSEKQMEEDAVLLGSDCAFFIRNRPVYAEGRGELLQDIQLSLDDFYLLLVIPNLKVSTAQAYGQCNPSMPEIPVKDIVKMPVAVWKHYLKNDFENLPLIPEEIHQIKQQLYGAGAEYASMSGSGSAVFGIFREKVNVRLRENYQKIWV